MKRKYSKYLIVFIALLILPLVVFATADFGLDTANPGLGDNNIKDIATSIINIALGFLGVITVGFILYGGFVWLTAGGSSEKVDKAKKIIIRAVIGLVIILSSYAIASFIITNIGDATGISDGSSNPGGPGGGVGGGDANLIVNNWQPYDGAEGTARNIMTRVYFNKIIDINSVANSDFTFTKLSDNTAVNFSLEIIGSRIDIHPLVTCDVEGVDYCLDSMIAYRVTVNNGSIISVDNKDLVCTSGCSTNFTTSDYIDNIAPSVSLLNPQDSQTFSITANVDIEAQAEDDSGVVAAMTFLADGQEVLPTGTDGAEPWQGVYSIVGYEAGDRIDMNATAEDLSGNIGTSGDITIRVLPEYCFNQVQDEDETDIDCGGSCGACLGENCSGNASIDICEPSDSLCGQGVCNLNCVCALAPVISNISPDNGAIGNYITITGDGFGSSIGSIVFLGSTSSGDEVTASLADCVDAWSPSQVIIEVPENVLSGGIKLITSSGDFDTTLDSRGWQGDFILNEIARPGICSITPVAGTALSNITITGTQFGDTKDRVLIGGISLTGSSLDNWSSSAINSLIPNLNTGNVSVAVGVGDELSNPVKFEIVQDLLIPTISYLEPNNGPVGTYVTIHGNSFGFSETDILVSFVNGDISIPADIDFPAMCGDYSVDNEEIVVKVPEGVTLDTWNVIVNRDQKESQPASFIVNNGVLSPGLCLLEPNNGPIGTIIDAYGESFGGSGQFSFFNNILAVITNWTSGYIGSLVPSNAETGPVKIMSGAGGVSNSINFEVGSCDANSCSPDNECCSDGICRETGSCEQSIGADEYIWSFTTGQQLPPFIVEEAWPECGDACINSMIGVRFSNPVDILSINNLSIDVKQCTDENCTAFVNEIDYSEGDVSVGYYDDTNYILSINPDGNLTPEAYYRVVIKSGSLGIVNTEGGYLENINYSSTGGEVDSYSWIFRTGTDECTLDRVEVLPKGDNLRYSPEGAILEATVAKSPNSCTNINLLFNLGVETESINNNSMIIFECNEEDCLSYKDGFNPVFNEGNVIFGYYDIANKTLSIQSQSYSSQSYYRVVLLSGDTGFRTVGGDTLGALNYMFDDNIINSYSWTFATNTDGCVVNIKNAISSTNLISNQNQTLNMTGYPFSEPDSCSPRGQMLDPEDFTWTWESTNTDVASVSGVSYQSMVVPIWGHPTETSIIANVDDVSDDAFVVVNMDIPRIDSISPDNGMINENIKTYVTVHGDNFGDTQGSTMVLVGGVEAIIADCDGSWSNTQIVVEMPLSTQDGDIIKIIKSGGEDESVPFDVNSVLRPAVCSINPNYGTENTKVTLNGFNFGDEQNDGTVFFDQLGVNQIDSWSNNQIKTRVPAGTATGPVTVNVLGNDSNSVIFSMEPYITSLDPDNGSVNSYVTIVGGNFGTNQGSGYVLIGNQRARLAPCFGGWSNTRIIAQIPEGLSLGNKDVQVITHYGITSNSVSYEVNEKPLNPLLCEISPTWAANNERVVLVGDNFGDSPYLGDQVQVDTALGANYINSSGSSCMSDNGSYVSGCSNYWVEYQFNFPETGYYNAWAETSNYSMDLTDQGIYHNVNIYLDGQYIGFFSNPASVPDHQVGSVGLGVVSAGNHTIRYSWTNDWCGGCSTGVGDSNLRIYNVGINSGTPMSYPLFSTNYIAQSETWANNRIPTYIESGMRSGPVSLITQVVTGQQCAGFHIGNWCPGGIYEDVIESVISNSVPFIKGCVIGTTSSRINGYAPTIATNSEAVGTLATDGQYIYAKSWGSYDNYDMVISIIGTGYQGTVLGRDYGDLARVSDSINMTYHSDGFLYNGSYEADRLEKIDVISGAVGAITVPTGLMERSTGNLNTAGSKLITSDGRFFYNLAYSHDGGTYNGYKVRVYDVENNWTLVREWISGTSSFYTDGIIADGKYIYAFEWGGKHRVRKMDALTGEFVLEWTSEQGNGGSKGSGNDIISGQYDWVNDRVWLGDLVDHDRYGGPAYIYKYNSCNTETAGIPLNCGDGILQLDEGEQCDSIVMEDGELASDWEVYDADPVGQYSVIYDDELQRNVIQLQTDGGTSTGFRLGNTGPSGDAWNYSGPNWDIQWRMKTYGNYRVYISTQTTLGHRYITYPAGHGGNDYVPIDVPAIYTDGEWHYVYRDLQADLETEEPGNQILEVNGFLIRGNTRVVDIAIGSDIGGQECSDLGNYNAGIIACEVSTCQLAGNDCALGIGYCGDGDIQWPNANNNYEMCDGAASLPTPVAHWAMDEDIWEIGQIGDVLDSSGNNDGQVMNGDIQTITDGVNGRAADFTASGNISIPISSDLQIQDDLTLAAWVYPRSRNIDDEDIIILGQGAYYLAIGNDGSLRTYWYGKSNPGYHSSTAESVPLNEWSHIVAVWDGSSGQVKLFVNGQLIYTVNSTGAGNQAVNQVWLGGEYSEPNQQRLYDGLMDEVKIWNIALSAQEVNAEFLGSTQNCTNECTIPSICGNGVVEYTEDCDDGNTNNGDSCSSLCTIEEIENVVDCTDGTNQITNAGFEINLNSWDSNDLPAPNGSSFIIDNSVARTGNKSLKMWSDSTDRDVIISHSAIDVQANTSYSLSAWVKALDVEDAIDSQDKHLWVAFDIFDESDELISDYQGLAIVPYGTYDWQRIVTEDYLMPNNASYIKLRIKNELETIGTVWFDDIQLEVGSEISDFVYSECDSEGICGNNILEVSETCEYVDGEYVFANSFSCSDIDGYSGGTLSCSPGTCEIVTTQCTVGIPSDNVCINTEISAEFDSLMDYDSFLGNVKFEKVTNICETGDLAGQTCSSDVDCGNGVCDLDVAISLGFESIPPNDSLYSKLYIYPESGLLDANIEYRVSVNGGADGVRDLEGYALESDYVWPFFTGDTECLIERVEIDPNSYEFNNSEEVVNFTVHGYDANNNSILGEYSWSVEGDDQLISVIGSNAQTVQISATGVGNGEVSLLASVYASEDSQGQDNAPIDIFMCNVPWAYENDTYNFKTRYCRGDGVNHIYNSSFEIDDNSDGMPDAWFDDIYDEEWQDISLVNSDLDNGGNYAIEINNLQEGVSVGDRTGIASDIIGIKDSIYTLSAQIKGETNGQLAYLGLKFMNADGVALGGNGGYHYPVLSHAPISDEWTVYSASFRPAEMFIGAEKVQIVFILAGGDDLDKHIAWIDNVQFELGSEATSYEDSNLLPALSLSPDTGVPTGDVELLNILFTQSDYNVSDAIGLRIFTNLNHVAPIIWYRDNVTNIGTPSIIDVDGYSALQEGRTTYVNASNYNDGDIYTNMFVLSYTQGANNNTQDIFTQMYNNWTFNSNIDSFNYTQKLIRDTHRWEDMMLIADKLNSYYQVNVEYPNLQVGTYEAGATVSVWDSWNNTLGSQLGGLPVDPINSHVSCPNGYDSVTCWNPNILQYSCPVNSYVYRYEFINPDYYVYSNFEFENNTWKGANELYVEANHTCDNVILNNGNISSTPFHSVRPDQ